MAMKDLYKNKLQTRTKELQSSQTNMADKTYASYDGTGGSTNVDNTIQNENSVNNTNNNWLNSLMTTIGSGIDKAKQYANNFMNQNQQQTQQNSSNATWRDYADLISAKTANSKMELQTAMQRAQSASNDYLKALGLQGSGVGQSQLTDLASNYQNSLSSINATAQTNVDTQLDSDFKSMVNSGEYSPQQLQDYINQYGAQTGKTTEWESYAKTMGATTENQVKNVIMDLDSMINSGDAYTDVNGRTLKLTDEQKKYARIIQNELIEAKTNEEKQNVLDKYNDFLNNPMKYEEISNLKEAMKKTISRKEWDSLSEDEKIKRRINAVKSGNYDGIYED